jgi:hypothetical protein
VAYVAGFFAVALLIAGLRARDTTGRVFFLACGLLNAVAAGAMIYSKDPAVYRLAPALSEPVDSLRR